MRPFTTQVFRARLVATALMLSLTACGGGGGNGSGNKCPIDCSAATNCDGFSFFVECAPTAGSTVRNQYVYDAFNNVISDTQSGAVYDDNGAAHAYTAQFLRGTFVGGRATTCSLSLTVEGVGTCHNAVP